MKQFLQCLGLLLALTAAVAAWSDEDHEIFRLRDEVIASEGQNTTFYSWLGIAQSAGQKDIDKAYRKLSRTLHPDKARSSWISTYDQYDPAKAKTGDTPGVKVQQHKKPSKREINAFNKAASARFARLGVVANILRGSERARYDHFLYNGFPAWRGTGYYYQRYRPGLGSVIFGLFIFVGGGVHYLALFLNWRKHKEFVGRYIRHARQTAWGDEGALGAVPGLGPSAPGMPADEEQEQPMNWNRRERRQRDKERAKDKKGSDVKVRPKDISAPIDPRVTSGPQGAKKRTVAENGKVLIVDSVGNVYLEQEAEDGQIHELLLDVDEIPRPTISDTVLVKLPMWAYNKTIGKALGKQTLEGQLAELIDPVDGDDDTQALKAALPMHANGEARRRRQKAKPR